MGRIRINILEVARILGVEIGEEFEILLENGSALDAGPYKFTSKTILDRDGEEIDGFLVIDLLNGVGTIQKSPWRPKEGELFWTINGKGNVEKYHFLNDMCDLALLNMGNCFPTKKAAKAAVPEMLEKFEEIKKGVLE